MINIVLATRVIAVLIAGGTLLFGLIFYICIRISEKRSGLWERVSEILKEDEE